jgi:hypothetical protein
MIRSFSRAAIFLAAAIQLPLTFAFGQYTISGTITDSNNSPVAVVDVFLYTDQGDPVGGINPGLSDGSGFYSIGEGNIPPGVYGVQFEPPSSTDLVPVLISPVNVQSNITLDVTLEFGKHLGGLVRDTLGMGIPDIDLNAFYESTGQAIILSGDNTDEFGNYDILVPTGLLRIVYRPVQGENLVPVELRNVNITGDTTIDVVLRAGFLLSGTVTGPGGQPVFDADIDVEDSFTGLKIYTPNDNTDSNGDYEVRVPAGTFDVSVQAAVADRLVPEIVYDVPISSNSVVNFALESGNLLSGTIRDPNSNVVANADLDVTRVSDGVKLFTPTDNTDVNGFYQTIIPDGLYDVDFKPAVVEPYLAPVRRDSVNVLADINLDVTVPFGILLSGHVWNFRGAGVLKVNIDAKETPTGLDVPLVGDNTDSAGAYAVVVAPAEYDLEYEPLPSDRLAAQRFGGVQLDINTVVDVVLDTGYAVYGTIRDSLGAPFPEVAATASSDSSGQPAFTPGNRSDSIGHYEILLAPDIYDLIFTPDPSSGLSDSIQLQDVNITGDTQIDINFPRHSGDSIAPSVTVISPNGGEIWQWLEQRHILWQATDNVGISAIDIFYSTTGPNGPYTNVASGEQNDGDFLWAVPPEPTDDARIRIVARDSSYNSSFDISDGSFTIEFANDSIAPNVTVLNPNGGETWQGLEQRHILWDASDNVGISAVDLFYSTTGSNGPYLNIASGEQDDGDYLWTVAPEPTDNAWVKITVRDSSYNSSFDISDGPFTIEFANTCCGGMKGDVNGNGTTNGVDVVYFVSYLKGGSAPPVVCDCGQYVDIFALADANGNCAVNGVDVVYMVSYFKGGLPLLCCPDCPR